MVYTQLKIIGSVFVYISNILNYTGDKLKSNIYVIHLGKTGKKKLCYSYKNTREMNVFWSTCRNIRGNESGLMAEGKHF